MSRGELPYISHIGMCRPEGYIYFVSRFGLKTGLHFAHLFWNRVSFSMELRGWFCFGFSDSVLSFVILLWVLRFCFEFCDSGFVILFWVLWFCFEFFYSALSFVILFGFCDSVLSFVIRVLWFCFGFCDSVILFCVLCFCFGFCDSVLSFVFLFWVLWFCFEFCDSVLLLLATLKT